MARWMVLYSDEDGDGRCAIVNDSSNSNMPYGSNADLVICELPDYNSGGTTFIIELPDDGEPMVISGDQEIRREFVEL